MQTTHKQYKAELLAIAKESRKDCKNLEEINIAIEKIKTACDWICKEYKLTEYRAFLLGVYSKKLYPKIEYKHIKHLIK